MYAYFQKHHLRENILFRLIQETLMEVEHFGKKPYEEVVPALVNSGCILKK